jgi:hypothetical protein
MQCSCVDGIGYFFSFPFFVVNFASSFLCSALFSYDIFAHGCYAKWKACHYD